MTSLGNRLSSLRRLHPSLLLVATGIVALQTGVLLVGWMLTVDAQYWTGLWSPLKVAGYVAIGLALVATLPLYSGLYVPIAERTGETRETLSTATRAAWVHYRALLELHVRAIGVAVAGGITAALVWFVVATGRRYLRLVTTERFPLQAQINASAPEYGMFLAFLLGFLVVASLVRFADGLVLFTAAEPETAWRSSLQYARRQPVSALGQTLAFVCLVCLHAISLALLTIAIRVSFTGGLFVATASPVTGGAITVLAVIALVTLAAAVILVTSHGRVATTSQSITPAVTGGSGGVLSSRQIGVAVLLLSATLFGAGYVRAADLETGEQEIEALPDDPETAYEVAASNTFNASHREVYLRKNASRDGGAFSARASLAVDLDDREWYAYQFENRTTADGIYVSEGVIADQSPTRIESPRRFDRHAGEWRSYHPIRGSEFTADPFTYRSKRGFGRHPYSDRLGTSLVVRTFDLVDANWTVAEVNDSAIRYRIDRTSAIRSTVNARSERVIADDSYIALSVDRDEAVLRRLTVDVEYVNESRGTSYRISFEDVGSTDVERPAEISPRSPVEWFWDVMYY